ncbi:hypothetical protein [Sorangium sp. So ce426]|uniref:hypothetical protein n=1 Tax=unclassified Sorangium TaxID=2621164 RepID=UPI003F5C6812
MLIAKLDPDGGLAWARRYGGPGDEFGAKIAALSDGSLVNAGGYVDSLDVGTGPIPSAGLSDIYVMRTDPAGDVEWVRHFGDQAYQDVYGLSVDGEDNVVVLGSFEGTVDFGAGPVSSAGAQDIFLFKLDPAGITLWSKGVGSDSSDGSVALQHRRRSARSRAGHGDVHGHPRPRLRPADRGRGRLRRGVRPLTHGDNEGEPRGRALAVTAGARGIRERGRTRLAPGSGSRRRWTRTRFAPPGR